MYYTQQQIDRANEVDLVEFLRRHNEDVITSGAEYRWKRHDSLTLCRNKWYRHSCSRGGHPIDFVMEFYGKTFPQAIEALIGEPPQQENSTLNEPSPEFHLPNAAENMDRMTRYLTQTRGVSQPVVDAFISAGSLYEDDITHNAVFVGRDDNGVPRYAFRRSCGESKWRGDVQGSDKSYNFKFSGTNDQLFVFEAAIDLMSFIDLYPKDWRLRNYVALGGTSPQALDRFLQEHKNISHVFLCLDNDKAGEDACTRLTEGVPANIDVTVLCPVLKDWNEVLLHRDEFKATGYLKKTVVRELTENDEKRVSMIRMSDVKMTDVEWLWNPYIPFGKLTIIQGNPGEGKTYVCMQLAAACTSGTTLPNMDPLPPMNVIYQTAEDGLGDTIKPRLMEAGADLNRVLVIDDSETPLTLDDERIEKAILQNHARLMIIDPIQAYLGANVDMNRANEVRPIFRKLGNVAQRTGCAIILIGHLNKSATQQTALRGLGSVDFSACVRSLLFIGRTKKDPNLRVMTHEKSSLAPLGTSLTFILGDEDGFRWVGESSLTADDIMTGASAHGDSKLQQAKELIRIMCVPGQEVQSSDIDRAAIEKGISTRTVRDAKKSFGDKLKSRMTNQRKRVYTLVDSDWSDGE